MVRELEMDRKTRLSGRASSVPEWLIDQKPPARRASPTFRISGSKSSLVANAQGKAKPDQTAPPGPSGQI